MFKLRKTLNILEYMLFIIVCAYLIFLVIDENNTIKKNDIEIKALQAQRGDGQYMIENLTIISKLQYMAEGRKISDLILYEVNKDSTNLNSLLSQKGKLVFFFSEQSCSICFLPFLKKLEKLSNIIGEDNIIVMGKFSNNRSFKTFLIDNNIKQKIYRVNRDLDIFHEYNDYAMAFILSKDMVIDKFIIIDKTNVSLSDNYIEIIKKRFAK